MSIVLITAMSIGGTALPLWLGGTGRWNTMAIDVLTFFTGGVFLGAGMLHMLPEAAEQAEEAGVTEGCTLLRVAGVKVYDDFEAVTVIKSVKRPLQMWFSKGQMDKYVGLSDKERKAKEKAQRKQEQKDAKAKRKQEKELQKARKKALKEGLPLVGDGAKASHFDCLFVRSSLY